MTRSVAVVFGMTEGRGHDRKLNKVLREHGFTVTRKVSEADVIISHSGGAYLIPKNIKAQLILLVGLPFWPGRHPSKNLGKKVKFEFTNKGGRHNQLKFLGLNIVMFFGKPRHNYRMWRNWKKGNLVNPETADILVVRNQHDVLAHHKELQTFASDKKWGVLSMPGVHDDLWLHPERYVDVVEKYLDNN